MHQKTNLDTPSTIIFCENIRSSFLVGTPVHLLTTHNLLFNQIMANPLYLLPLIMFAMSNIINIIGHTAKFYGCYKIEPLMRRG